MPAMTSPSFRRAALFTAGALALTTALSSCSAQNAQQNLNRLISTRGLTVQTDLAYGRDARQRLDIYAPQGAQNAPTVLFIHGGSWNSGEKSEYRFVGESLARAGYVVGVMNYRLAPQSRYPSYVQDSAQALAFLRSQAAQYGGSPDNLFVMGHSAGAFNAVEAVVNGRWLREAGVPVSAVRGVIGLAGPYSYDFRDYSSREAFPQGGLPDEIMPDRHVRRDAPPHLLLVAENDTTVHPQNALNMERALKAAGVPVERRVVKGVNHVTIAAALARPLGWLGDTRSQVLEFIEARRLR